MDTDIRTTADRDVDPGQSLFQRESSWDDVEAAQADMQRRFRPLWWVYLCFFAVIAGAYSLLFASYDAAPMFLVVLVVLIVLIPLVPSVRRATGSTMQAGLWPVLITGIVVFANIYLASFLRPDSDGSAPLPPLLSAVAMGALFTGLLLLTELLHLRRIGSAGRQLAARMKPGCGVEVDFLRDADTLGVMMRLAIPREIAVTALQKDTGLSSQQLSTLLDRLRDQRMIEVREHLFIGGRGSTWATLSPGGERELAKHLATLRPDHA